MIDANKGNHSIAIQVTDDIFLSSSDTHHNRNRLSNKVCKAIQGFFKNLWEFCKEDPSRVTFSLKVGLAVTVCSLLMLVRKPYDAFGSNAVWSIMTVAVVFEYTVGATYSKGVNRALGSFAAGVMALCVAQVALSAGTVAQPVVIGFSVFLVGSVTSFMKLWPSLKEYEYSFRVILFTFSLIVVSTYRVGNPVRTTIDRLSSISIGGAVTMVVCSAIFPCWAGDQLHKQIVKNFDCVADSLEECVKQYLEGSTAAHGLPKTQAPMGEYEGEPAFNRYKSALDSSAAEEAMAKSAKWEPPHGKFRQFFYPWSKYVKVGAVLRHCAYEVMALHGCLHSEIQAPYSLRKAFDSELREASTEAAALVRELGRSINHMQQCSLPKLLLENVHTAALRLQSKVDQHSYLLLEPKPRTVISPELSQSSALNSPRSSSFHKNDAESYCEKLCSMPSPKEFDDPDEEENDGGGGEGGLEKTRGSDIASNLALGTFASLLMEFIARLDHLVEAVHELGVLAKFKFEK